jgi:methylphosphotriester-DNA--protein-cysteine methyltransferase
MKLFIKNMVCIRCKMIVKEELKKLGIPYSSVEIGEVELRGSITPEQRAQFASALLKAGLELINDKKNVLVEKVKNVIVELVHNTDEQPKVNYSQYISKKLDHDYTYLANLFSKEQGTTIEKFIIIHKIERVKQLLVYNEMNLTEIAYKLNYSSVAHLSNQFKKVTRLTPSYFKQIKTKRRLFAENLPN